MKKIINGRKYDTETAEALGVTSHGESPSDFRYYEETLYRKRTGEFFLYGSGGPMTCYGRSIGCNSWAAGWNIIPYTEKMAKQWAEEELSVDEYEAIFGSVEE